MHNQPTYRTSKLPSTYCFQIYRPNRHRTGARMSPAAVVFDTADDAVVEGGSSAKLTSCPDALVSSTLRCVSDEALMTLSTPLLPASFASATPGAFRFPMSSIKLKEAADDALPATSACHTEMGSLLRARVPTVVLSESRQASARLVRWRPLWPATGSSLGGRVTTVAAGITHQRYAQPVRANGVERECEGGSIRYDAGYVRLLR